MAEIDGIKELIGFLKVFFALLLAAVLGLTGWLAQNFDTISLTIKSLSFFAVFCLAVTLFFIFKVIRINISYLKRL